MTLQYWVGFCHTSTWISHRYIYILPPSWNSYHLPPPSHPSRLSQNIGLSSRSHTAKSHLLSILHMAMYMFPCYSLNSPTLSFLHCCVRSLFSISRLHCCPANRFISMLFHALIHKIFFLFMTWFTLYNRL